EPIPFLVWLQVGLTEVTPHLSHRDRWHDAALDDFRDQLTSCPMGDGPTGLRRWFTGDGQDLNDLLGRELAGRAGRGPVVGDLSNRWAQGGMTVGALDPNEPIPGIGPASSPEADLPLRQSDCGGDLGVAPLLEGQQDDGRSVLELSRGRGGVADRPEEILLTFGDGHFG